MRSPSPNRTIRSLLLTGALLLLAFSGPALAEHSNPTGAVHPGSHRARAAHTFQIGIGDEQTEMFTNPLYQQLHTKIVRYVVPYDAVSRPYTLGLATSWIHAAEAAHQQVLIAFYHSEYTPTKMPSVSLYQRDVQKFVKLFPHVKQYESWDEANRGTVKGLFSSPSAAADAEYYQALKRVCSGCQLIGLDILDQENPTSTLRYITEFKKEIGKLRTVMPKVWGLHDYSDVNRLEGWRTREIDSALGGEVWLTETGGIVQFGRGFPNKKGSGLTRAAKVLKFTFQVAASESRVTRLYLYDWTGGTKATRFDAGLMSAVYKPRPGYLVLCKEMHAVKCNLSVSKE